MSTADASAATTETSTNAATTQQQSQQSADAALGVDDGDSVEARAEALKLKLMAERPVDDEEGAELGGEEAEAPPPPPEQEKARAERRARLKALQDAERQRAATRSQTQRQPPSQQQQPFDPREFQQAQQRAQQAEAMLQRFAEDPDAVVEYALKSGKLNLESFAESVVKRYNDPGYTAEHRARAAVTPELEAVRQERAKVEQLITQFQQAQEAQAHAARQEQAHTAFVSQITPEAAPLAHNMIQKAGRAQFIELAEAVADTLPHGAGFEALTEAVEEHLERIAALFSTQQSSPSSQQSTPNSRAAAKATTRTVSNALASGRATVVDDENQDTDDDVLYRRTLALGNRLLR